MYMGIRSQNERFGTECVHVCEWVLELIEAIGNMYNYIK